MNKNAGMSAITVAIIDDEPLAREGIRNLLAVERDVAITGEFGDGVDALEALEIKKPDLLFLDVQMPGMDGFELLAALPEDYQPAIVFVTAFDKFAIKAFEVHALDYLTKPVDPARFREALEHAKQMLRSRDAATGPALLKLLDDVRKRDARPQRLAIRSVGKIELIAVADIDYVQAAGDYVSIHVRGAKHFHKETMARIERILDAEKFVRIHRSVIVNADRVKELQPLFKGDYVVILIDGTKLTLSRTYKDQALARLTEI
jgi:two-component system LytT family response regulator